jgi:hypothetical protein
VVLADGRSVVCQIWDTPGTGKRVAAKKAKGAKHGKPTGPKSIETTNPKEKLAENPGVIPANVMKCFPDAHCGVLVADVRNAEALSGLGPILESFLVSS